MEFFFHMSFSPDGFPSEVIPSRTGEPVVFSLGKPLAVNKEEERCLKLATC
jgi:hypothetical protein